VHISQDAWLTLSVDLTTRHSLGSAQGFERRCVEVVGGKATGKFEAEMLPSADWQTVWPDGTTELDVHFMMRTTSGSLVEVRGFGLRSGSVEIMQAVNSGKAIDPDQMYFRAVYRFITSDPALKDFNHRLFIGVPRRDPPARLYMDIFSIE
jgi:Protein of unknown function (DUF3237).